MAPRARVTDPFVMVRRRREFWIAAVTEFERSKLTDYSLIATCDLHDVDPLAYLRDVLLRVDTHPASDIDAILPHRWTPPPPGILTVDDEAA